MKLDSKFSVLALSAVIALSCASSASAESDKNKSVSTKETKIAKGKDDRDGVLIAKAPASIPWQNSYATTLKLARDGRKWVLVDVFTDWCHWCKKLDADVYADPKVIGFINKSFVCMKANAEKGDGIQVKGKYGVDGYPCTLILEPGGKEKGRINGYLSATEFPQELARILQSK